MEDYTKGGGFNKLMKFTKKKLVLMYIEDLKKLKHLKSTIQTTSTTTNIESNSNLCEAVANNSIVSEPDAIVSEPDVLVVSPTQVINKTFLGNEDDVFTPNRNSAEVSEKNDVPENQHDDVSNRIFDTHFNADESVDNTKNFDDVNIFENPGINNFISSSNSNSSPFNELLQRIEVLEEDNKALYNKMYDVEVKSTSNDQYSRRNNFEIAGIPDNIQHENLESTVGNILNRLNIKVGWNDFQACHRLKNHPRAVGPEKTIVRFVNRKHTIMALSKKKTVKDIDFSDIMGDSSKIYISENLCPAYRQIYDAAYKLLKRGVIKHLWSFKGVVHIRTTDNSDYITFKHMDDFRNYF